MNAAEAPRAVYANERDTPGQAHWGDDDGFLVARADDGGVGIDLEGMSYRELQQMAKRFGFPANQKRVQLERALRERDDDCLGGS